MKPAIGYMRTSTATNVGADKDSEKRQRAAIEAYAAAAGYTIAESDWYYDAAVKGADAITDRPGFSAMLERIAGNGVRTIIVESPDRFARDLIIQLTGHDHLKALGIDLIPASAPTHFLEDTPTATLVRQVLGAIAQFEKANLVARMRAARDRKRKATGKCGGRKSLAELRPDTVAAAISLAGPDVRGRRMPLRNLAEMLASAGHVTPTGKPYSTSAVQSMLSREADSRVAYGVPHAHRPNQLSD